MKKELIYIGDPMCSWCWGFSPVLQEIRKQFQDHLAFSVIVGGLRAGTSENLTEDLKQDIRGHWTEVNKMTGQPFHLISLTVIILFTIPNPLAVQS